MAPPEGYKGFELNQVDTDPPWAPRENVHMKAIIDRLVPSFADFLVTNQHRHQNLYDSGDTLRVALSPAEMVINGAGDVYNVRIAGAADSDIFAIDANANRVGVLFDGATLATAPPAARFHVRGSVMGMPDIAGDTVAIFSDDNSVIVSIITNPGGESRLFFGDEDNQDEGAIRLIHSISPDFVMELRGNGAIHLSLTEVVINTEDRDLNFRVAGLNDPNLLFCEATGAIGANNVRIGTNEDGPNDQDSKLHIFKAHGGGIVTLLTLSTDLTIGGQEFVDFRVSELGDLSIWPFGGNGCTEQAVGISIEPTSKLHVYTNLDADDFGAVGHFHSDSDSASIPVLRLTQDDESEGFIDFVGSDRGVITGVTNSLASIRVERNGTIYRLALYADG